VERMLVLLSEDAHSAAPGRNVTIEGQLVVRESSG
jgi:hypothetical protein